MKKMLLTLCGMMVLGSLCACGNKGIETKSEKKQTATEASVDDEKVNLDKEDKKEDNKELTTEEKKETTTEANKESAEDAKKDPTIEVITETNQNTSMEQSTQAPSSADLPSAEVTVEKEETTVDISNWPDIVELVNDKGDKTTGYLLADGDYMDRVTMRYTYDGKGTWTDTNGVKWSAVAK